MYEQKQDMSNVEHVGGLYEHDDDDVSLARG
jgi:hypothetical protein